MALGANTIWEVQTGGDDTNFGGGFDPSQTAGMLTDGAATVANTSAPIFSSASYNFVAGDVGAWVFIASGTNWIPGWYVISSVATNKATLNGTIGQGVKIGYPQIPTTVVGCATVASPTSATWSIDYSQQGASRFTYTDISATGTSLVATSAGNPFGKQQVGNIVVITGGTNFTAGRYCLASVSGVSGTFLGAANMHNAAGTTSDGAGRMGGALASPGKVAGIKVAGNDVFIKSGSYTITSASTNIAAGCILENTGGAAAGSNISRWEGYGSVRGDKGTKPVMVANNVITTFTLFNLTSGNMEIDNITFDGNSRTASTGANYNGNRSGFLRCKVQNCVNGFVSTIAGNFYRCEATTCSTVGFDLSSSGGTLIDCEAYANTCSPINAGTSGIVTLIRVMSYGNTGASSDGISVSGRESTITNCVAYGNGRHGFNLQSNGSVVVTNCIAEGHTAVGAFGFTSTAGLVQQNVELDNCGAFNNTTNFDNTNIPNQASSITYTASPFTNAAGSNFSLNNTTSAGAAARAAGTPGVFPAGLTTGYIDVGAAQHQDTGGGASQKSYTYGG